MKKRLLSFFAFALVALMAQAGSWQEPKLPLTTNQVPNVAYIYNVEQGKFLTKGGAWGNHAAIKADVKDAFLYEITELTDGAYELHCSAAKNTGKLGRNSDRDIYTDYKSGNWGLTWSFVKSESGYYHIINAASDPYYGSTHFTEAEETDLGVYIMAWDPNAQDLTNGDGAPMGTNDGVYMVDPTNCEGMSTEWAFLTAEDGELYAALVTLYNKLNEAEEMGYAESDLASQAALLASTDIEAVNAAAAEVEELILNYAYNHATPDNPFEVTSVITNPTFEGAVNTIPAGWTDEFDNMHIQNNKAYNVFDDDNNDMGEYGFNNFVQNWTKSDTEPITESNIYQVIADLPQGTYILQADCIATSPSAGIEVSGAELYAQSGAVRYAAPIDKSPYGTPGNPKRYQITFVHMGGELTIGYGFVPGYAKWFGADNFKLFYAGKVDNPGLVALMGAIGAAQVYQDQYGDPNYYYSEATKDDLDDELTTANELASEGNSDKCLEQATVLNGLVTKIKQEVSAYNKLNAFVETVQADLDRYPFIATLPDFYDEVSAAYEDCDATIEQINAWIDGYKAMIVDGVKAAMSTATADNPIEVTALYDNLGFEQNTVESATPANWTCDASAFKARVNTGEVWQASFTATTTLTNLPAGSYKITAHGLSRHGGSVESYTEYQDNGESAVTAEFFANGTSVKVKDQSLGATETKLHSSDVNLLDDGDPDKEDTEFLWAPNSMEGARAYFNVAENPYLNTVTTVLIKDNDPLVIGFRDFGDDGEGAVKANSWTIWSDVRVYYLGAAGASALYEEMLALSDHASDLQHVMVAEADKKLNAAINNAEATSPTDEAAITAAINELNDALAYYNAGLPLIDEAMALHAEYQGITSEITSSDEVLPAIIDEMGDAISNESFESNEQIQAWIDNLPAARTNYIYTACVTDEGLTPSEEEPVEVSAIMVNPSFADGSKEPAGWTWTYTGGTPAGGDDQRTRSTCYEFWNSSAFDMHQTIVGLPAGWYKLTVSAIYRNGNNSDDLAKAYQADPAAASKMQFYANDKAVTVINSYAEALALEEGETYAVSSEGEASFVLDGVTYQIPNKMVCAHDWFEAGHYLNTLYIQVDGNTDVTIGLREEGCPSYSWAIFDDFKIYAIGDKAPVDGIQAVGTKAPVSTVIYDLSGRRVSKAGKGIYIVGGKKVLF